MKKDTMKIFLYADSKDETAARLEKLIQNKLPGIQSKRINSIKHLSQNLCQPLHNVSVIVFFVFCEKDLHQLIQLKPLFDNTRLILILPDGIKSMMTLGIRLNPCFISYSDNDFNDVISVLEKINQREMKIGKLQEP